MKAGLEFKLDGYFFSWIHNNHRQLEDQYHQTSNGTITKVIVDTSLIKIWIEGPAVSLQGSPTVSPVTAAKCTSVFFKPIDSQYFFVLSQAPPPLFKNKAIKIPVAVENIKKAQTAFGPRSYWPVTEPIYLKIKDTTIGERTERSPGFTIYLWPAAVTISTHLV